VKRIIILCITACVQATTISTSCQHALQGDHRYLAAQADYAATIKQEDITRDALKPQLHSQLIIAREHFSAKQSNSDTLTDTYVAKKADITIEQPLIDFSAYRQFSQAALETKKAAIRLEQAKQHVWLRVVDHYLQVLKQQALYEAAASERQTLAEQQAYDKKRLQSGTITKADWLATEAQLAAAQAHEIAMHGDLLNAVAQYEALTDIQHPRFFAPAKDYLPEKPQLEGDSDRAALVGNLTIQSELAETMIAQKHIEVAQAQHYPTVHAYGTYTNQHNPNGILSTYSPINDTATTSVGINVHIPIYQGGQVVDQTDQAQYLYESTAQRLAQTRNDISVELTMNRHNLITNYQQIQALQQGVSAAKSALASQKAGYEAGTKTNVALLNAISQLQASQSQYAVALFGYLHNRLYRQYLAGHLQLHDIQALDKQLKTAIDIPPLTV
jgi:TolC family type I secretion outer membrane protein